MVESHEAHDQVVLTGHLSEVTLLERDPGIVVLPPGQLDHGRAQIDRSHLLVTFGQYGGDSSRPTTEVQGGLPTPTGEDAVEPLGDEATCRTARDDRIVRQSGRTIAGCAEMRRPAVASTVRPYGSRPCDPRGTPRSRSRRTLDPLPPVAASGRQKALAIDLSCGGQG